MYDFKFQHPNPNLTNPLLTSQSKNEVITFSIHQKQNRSLTIIWRKAIKKCAGFFIKKISLR